MYFKSKEQQKLCMGLDQLFNKYRSPRLPPFFPASIREGRVALSVGHPRGTHSRYVIGCCPIPHGICGLENNSRRITHGIECVRRIPSPSPLSSLVYMYLLAMKSENFTLLPNDICFSLQGFRAISRPHILAYILILLH